MQYCYKQNRFQQLRGFCYSAMAGSITEGAKRLHLSQPSVTQQIQALEREMGVQLFDRRQGGIKLTREGEALFELSRGLIEQMESLEQRFNRLRTKAGVVRVVVASEMLLGVLLPLIEKCRRENPKIQLQFQVAGSALSLWEALKAEGAADFAFGEVFLPERAELGNSLLNWKGIDGLEFYPVLRSEPVLVSPRGHPLGPGAQGSPGEIVKYPLVLPSRGTPLRASIDAVFAKSGVCAVPAIEVDAPSLIKELVGRGLGISILPNLCLGGGEGVEGDEPLQRVNVREFFPGQEYGIVLSASRELSPQARHFASLILSERGASDAERSGLEPSLESADRQRQPDRSRQGPRCMELPEATYP